MLLVIITILGALFSAIVAFITLLNNPSSRLHRWLFVFVVSAGIWILAVNAHTLFSIDIAVWLLRLSFVSVGIAGFSMLQFVHSVTQRGYSKYKISELITTGLIVLLSLSPFVVASFTRGEAGYLIPTRGIAYPIVIVLILFLIFKAFFVLERTRRIVKGRSRTQLGVILFGLITGTIFGVTTNVILPNLLLNTFPSRFAFIAVVLWTVVLVYAVVQYRFLDIRLAVIRTIAYVLTFIAVISIYTTLVLLLTQTFFKDQSLQSPLYLYDAILVFIVALTFNPIKTFFDRITRRLFYRNAYSTQEVLNATNSVFIRSVELDDLARRSLAILDQTLRPQFIVLVVAREKEVEFSHSTVKTPKSTERLLALAHTHKNKTVLITDQLAIEAPKAADKIREEGVAIITNVETSSGHLGYMFFGFKANGANYTHQDIELIHLVTDGLAVALQNALRFQEISNFSSTLQDKIKEATKELRATNAQLQRLDTAKDEFVSMASHQLRTPLTSVKGYISMVLEGDAGKITATQRQLLGEAFTSSERMVHLINDFLNVSRLQTGKFMLEYRQVDLSKILSQEVESLQTTARMHDLTLHYREPSYFPMLYLDEGKIRQVIMNFIDNAIYYSPEETVINVELSVVDGQAVLEVHDTGIGVPKAEQEHLFGKFFRATNARKQRPDGTGVGLFLAKKVIVAHGGTIVFRSAEGQGSVFGFRLPVKKLSHLPANSADKLRQ